MIRTNTRKTVYEIHYGAKALKDRKVMSFEDLDKAAQFFEKKTKQGIHCTVFEVMVQTTTTRTQLNHNRGNLE